MRKPKKGLRETKKHRIRVRNYPWGNVIIENGEHCDTMLLRKILIHTHMEDLKESTDILYEKYRADLIKANLAGSAEIPKSGNNGPLSKFEQERIAFDQKLIKMEAEMQAVFNQKVAEKEEKLKKTEIEVSYIKW